MVNWFVSTAPIRLKLKIAFGTLAAVPAVLALIGLAQGSIVDAIAGFGGALLCVLLGSWFRERIVRPYVATVVRMEALAAGDLGAPIEFTDYSDCVGRLTRAMFVFRDAAVLEQSRSREQAAVVATLAQCLSALRDGDLSRRVETEFPEDYAELRTSYNAAVEALAGLIAAVSESTETIRSGTNEIAEAAGSLAYRTEANAASLEETAAAITQMDGRIQATAQAAEATVGTANTALGTVGTGRELAGEAVDAMNRVSGSARAIDDVIEGLDKVAFQTRVLAMNAAVEAGRAGTAGQGFAVVADLVSDLARRAETEAKQARDQLTIIQTEISAAAKTVGGVDESLQQISSAVSEVHELLNRIALDNKLQSGAVSEVRAAVATMESATQQNAAMVEETSAASRQLLGKVEMLSTEANRFTVEAPRRGSRLPRSGQLHDRVAGLVPQRPAGRPELRAEMVH